MVCYSLIDSSPCVIPLPRSSANQEASITSSSALNKFHFSFLAEAGLGSTGAGVKLSVGSIQVKLANAVDASLGLGLDTGVALGLNRLDLKILGSGVNISPNGSELCFFGSCLRFFG